MESTIIKETPVHYNLRKRYNNEIADRIISYWFRRHVPFDEPENADEAVFYYVFGEAIN